VRRESRDKLHKYVLYTLSGTVVAFRLVPFAYPAVASHTPAYSLPSIGPAAMAIPLHPSI
jgi:hypothetical protein